MTVLSAASNLFNSWFAAEFERFQHDPVAYMATGGVFNPLRTTIQALQEMWDQAGQTGKEALTFAQALAGTVSLDLEGALKKVLTSLDEYQKYTNAGDTENARRKLLETAYNVVFLKGEVDKIDQVIKPGVELFILYKFFGESLLQDAAILLNAEANCVQKAIAAGDIAITFIPAAKALSPSERLVLRVSDKTILAKGTTTLGSYFELKMGRVSLRFDEKAFWKAVRSVESGNGEFVLRYLEERGLLKKSALSIEARGLSVEFLFRQRASWGKAMLEILGLASWDDATVKRVLQDKVRETLLAAADTANPSTDVQYKRIDRERHGYMITVTLGQFEQSKVKAYLWLGDETEKVELVGLEKDPCEKVPIPPDRLMESCSPDQIELWESVIHKFKPQETRSAVLPFGLALCYAKTRDKFSEALQLFALAISINPQPEFFLSRAQLYVKMERFEEAIPDLEAFLAYHPNNTDVQAGLAGVLGTLGLQAEDARNYKKAAKYYRRALQYAPNQPALLEGLRICTEKLGGNQQ
ncbi:MAG: hypothetical protein HYS22_08185 [Deltaproteobacteria bacterium]|nr:hypothetical protein [Deltaproteobacteria bacterium]